MKCCCRHVISVGTRLKLKRADDMLSIAVTLMTLESVSSAFSSKMNTSRSISVNAVLLLIVTTQVSAMEFTFYSSFQAFSSGYEVKSTKVNGAAFSETFDELLFLKSQKLCFQINDKDVNIDIGREKKTSKVSIPPSPSENSKSDSKSSAKSLESRTQSKQKRRKITKSKSTKSEIIQPLIEESKAPQWLTEIQLIPGEISIEQNNLIRFYDNPLNELPSSNAVG